MVTINNLVVKSNALIDASFNLTLVEHRLLLLGITTAREAPSLTPDTPIKIQVKSYIDLYKTDDSNTYSLLKEAVKTLKRREFTYLDTFEGIQGYSTANWVNKVTYLESKGTIILYMSHEVISMISRLERNFTKYLINQVSAFSSKHSIRLYELIIKYRDLNKTKKFEVHELRSSLGIQEHEYKLMSDFKKRVIDVAVAEISNKSDVHVVLKQFKQGRAITHFQFTFRFKSVKGNSKDNDTIDIFTGLTPKQVDMFADKLSRSPTFQSHFQAEVGESIESYANRIAEKLNDSFYVEQWKEYLIDVGYKKAT